MWYFHSGVPLFNPCSSISLGEAGPHMQMNRRKATKPIFSTEHATRNSGTIGHHAPDLTPMSSQLVLEKYSHPHPATVVMSSTPADTSAHKWVPQMGVLKVLLSITSNSLVFSGREIRTILFYFSLHAAMMRLFPSLGTSQKLFGYTNTCTWIPNVPPFPSKQ